MTRISTDYYSPEIDPSIEEYYGVPSGETITHMAFVFRSSGYFELHVTDAAKRIEINQADMDVRIIGNFDVETLSVNPSFSTTGTWYSYFEGDQDRVDLSSLTPGLYILNRQSGSKNPQQAKVIVE